MKKLNIIYRMKLHFVFIYFTHTSSMAKRGFLCFDLLHSGRASNGNAVTRRY